MGPEPRAHLALEALQGWATGATAEGCGRSQWRLNLSATSPPCLPGRAAVQSVFHFPFISPLLLGAAPIISKDRSDVQFSTETGSSDSRERGWGLPSLWLFLLAFQASPPCVRVCRCRCAAPTLCLPWDRSACWSLLVSVFKTLCWLAPLGAIFS